MLLIIYIPEREEEGATHPLSTLLGEEPPKLPATGSKDSQIYCRRVEEWESVDLSSYTCYRLAKLIPRGPRRISLCQRREALGSSENELNKG